ncbi:hypothetical protein FACS189420_6440 [Bacteroidia bacterium]|nr:hypothetical protein FACS189420_6440 [Bacteroidia bacterium]
MRKLIVWITLFAAIPFVLQAQDVETLPDSIKGIDTLRISKDFNSFELKEYTSDKSLLPSLDATMLNLSEEPLFRYPNPDLKYTLPRFDYFSDEFLTVYPIRYGFNSWYQGGDLLGVNSHFQLTNFLTGNLGLSYTSSFLGPMYPQRYHNGSVSLDLTWKLHDRIRINTYGQYSVREGINPALSPMINGGNYYGGEVQVKIYKNFGIGVGFVNSYYRKNWTLQPTARPMVFD